MKRVGAKKSPAYRIVVADSRTQRDGRPIEELGYYDPTVNPSVFKIQEEKAVEWLMRGAQPTPTAKTILRRAGVLDKWTEQKAK